MTLHWIDLTLIAVLIVGGIAACYAVLLRKLRVILHDRAMNVADQIGALDNAVRALEARLAEHQMQMASMEQPERDQNLEDAAEEQADLPEDESSEIEPEIQVAIAAAAVAALGPNAQVNSVNAVPSPWTQQGRVLVQGGHNLRVRR